MADGVPRSALLGVAAIAWLVVLGVGLTADDGVDGIEVLLVVPPAAIGAAFGIWGGLLAASLSGAAYFAVVELGDRDEIGAVGDAAYLAAFFATAAIAGVTGAALRGTRALVRDGRAENAELRATATQLVTQALEAEDRERERIAQDLHDGAMQDLLVANQDLLEVSHGREGVTRAQQAVAEVIGEMRNVVSDLHPATASHGDLEASLRSIAEMAAELGRFEVAVVVDRGARDHHDALILSVARELLTNAAKHARATRVSVAVRADGSQLGLTVSDDGVGIGKLGRITALTDGHIGLASIAERLKAVGGSLDFSNPPGGGTVAKVWLPLNA